MLKKDYLQRKIEEFGKALALLLSKKRQLDFEKELHQLSKIYLKNDSEQMEKLSEKEFIHIYMGEASPDRTKLKISADVLYETLIYRMESQTGKNTNELVRKCKLLYTFLLDDLTENEFDLGIHYRLKMLEQFSVQPE